VASVRPGANVINSLPTLLLITVIAVFIYYTYSYTSTIDDYISDECWYVSSARNILIKVFNLTPKYVGSDSLITGVTLEVSNVDSALLRNLFTEVGLLNGRVVKYDYSKVSLVYVEVPQTNVSRLRDLPYVKRVVPGYRYPDAANILDYLNTEHPPLVKYLIALSIITCGDRPTCWRVPSIIAASLILITEYFIMRVVVGGVSGSYLGLAACVLTVLDPLFRSLSMVAMLDIFVSLFTVVTLLLVICERYRLVVMTLGLGFISKYSSLFPAPAVMYLMRRSGMSPAKILLYVIYVPLLLLLISSSPLIKSLGFQQWWFEAIENAVRWHLSVKTLNGPPVSAPWDWIIGNNPFILHYTYVNNGWVADLVAKGNNAIYLMTTALTIFTLPVIRRLPDGGKSTLYTWTTFLMYVIMWVLGGRTQYSFYMVQITPLLYLCLIIQVYWLTTSLNNIKDLLKKWLEILTLIQRWLSGEVTFKISVKIEQPHPMGGNAGRNAEIADREELQIMLTTSCHEWRGSPPRASTTPLEPLTGSASLSAPAASSGKVWVSPMLRLPTFNSICLLQKAYKYSFPP